MKPNIRQLACLCIAVIAAISLTGVGAAATAADDPAVDDDDLPVSVHTPDDPRDIVDTDLPPLDQFPCYPVCGEYGDSG